MRYTLFITEDCSYRSCGFQTANKHKYSTIEEAQAYMQKNDEMWDEFNRRHPDRPVKYVYRLKDNETKKIVCEWLKGELRK